MQRAIYVVGGPFHGGIYNVRHYPDQTVLLWTEDPRPDTNPKPVDTPRNRHHWPGTRKDPVE